MGGDKGEACDIFIRWKNVLTYFSRVVLFHITGFYQWSENSRDWVFWWLIKSSVNYVPWKLHIEISRIVLFEKLRRSIFKTSEVLYLRRYNQIFMITRFLETKPKTRDTTLCILEQDLHPQVQFHWLSYKERRVDALALRADERRDKLR